MLRINRSITSAARDLRRAIAFTALALAAVCAGAQSYNPNLLYEFPAGTAPVGSSPLIRDTAGNLYGATNNGGANGYGSVFELVNSNGSYSEVTLYSFTNSSDGRNPQAQLTIDRAGNLYGTALGGGNGAGIAYELQNANGAFNFLVIHTFTPSTDGGSPNSILSMDSAGNLYGTASGGGTYGHGGVFQLASNGAGGFTLNVLHMFQGPPTDCAVPAMIAVGPGNNLYGACRSGGPLGYGMAYMLQNSGGTYQFTPIYLFTGANNDDATPIGPPTLDAQGNIYMATAGISPSGGGSVVEFPSQGTEKVLYTFPPSNNNPGGDASNPNGPVVLDANGNIYGTTGAGGASGEDTGGFGTIFELVNNAGSYVEQVLYSFSGNGNGIHPSDLLMDSSGNLYGIVGHTSFTAGVGGEGPAAVWELAIQATTTTLTVTASPNPAFFGDDVTLSAAVTANSGATFLPGTITFSEGSTILGSVFTSNGTGSIIVTSNQIGAGEVAITAQFTPANSALGGSSAQVAENVIADSNIAVLNGSNTFSGSQTVNGSLTAANFIGGTFTGNGSGLTDVTAANFSGTISDSQVAGLTLDLVSAEAAAVAQAEANINGAFVPLTGGTMTGVLNAPGVNASGAVASGSLIIGGGTAITQYVSVTDAITVPALAPGVCASFQTPALTGFTPGDTDTISLGIPSQLLAGLTSQPPSPPGPGNGPPPPPPPPGPPPPPVYLNYQAWETSTASSPSITIQVCDISAAPYSGGAKGIVRIDIFKH